MEESVADERADTDRHEEHDDVEEEDLAAEERDEEEAEEREQADDADRDRAEHPGLPVHVRARVRHEDTLRVLLLVHERARHRRQLALREHVGARAARPEHRHQRAHVEALRAGHVTR